MKVTDHNKYRKFDYDNYLLNPNFELGQVVAKVDRVGEKFFIDKDNGNPIGVVIQLHDDGDCRTDMFGNCSPSEVTFATLEEIELYRPSVLDDIDLFDYQDELNESVKAVLKKYENMDNDYESCEKLLADLVEVGYTCEYGLDGVPINLKKI